MILIFDGYLIVSLINRLESEFSTLDECIKTHTQQLKEYQQLKKMLQELEQEQHQQGGKSKKE